MKLAFISDIHANLPALQAVLTDIKKYQPDNIYCLGDLVNFAGWDNEVVELIRNKNIITLQGNHDEGITYNKSNFSFSYNDEEQKKFGEHSIQLVNKTITDEHRKYLSNLPFMLQLNFRFPFHSIKIAMVHGSISSNNEYVKEDADDNYLLEMMNSIDADILLMGHTHKPFHKTIFCEEENKKFYRHAINVGSVGKPKHGDNKACYTLLNIDETRNLNEPDFVTVHFNYVDYDVDEVINHIHELGLGNAYDNFLKNGK